MENIFILKISLDDIKPLIWRELQVPGDFNLHDLHSLIQVSMGWENMHLHSFTIEDIYYEPKPEDDEDLDIEVRDEVEYTLDALQLSEKQEFFYDYDHGDNWEHNIIVSKIIKADGSLAEDKKLPKCLDGKRACPPEDCGGVEGYKELIKALADPKNKKHKDLLLWLKESAEGYNPEDFNLKEINAAIEHIWRT